MVYPLKVSNNIIEKRHVNLLLTEKNGQHHYTTIKNFSRLVSSQISGRERQHYFCYSCIHGCINGKSLKKHHKRSCKTDSAHRIKRPTDDPTLRFTNIHKHLKAPFVAYADFECILKDVRDREGEEVDTKTNITNVAPDVGPKTKDMYPVVLPSKLLP